MGPLNKENKIFLCVDDFGVKNFNKDDSDHLLNLLKNHYTISTNWEGRNYIGLKIYWNYNKGYVVIRMPDYVKKNS